MCNLARKSVKRMTIFVSNDNLYLLIINWLPILFQKTSFS